MNNFSKGLSSPRDNNGQYALYDQIMNQNGEGIIQ